MDMTEDGRTRLADAMNEQRLLLGLSVRAAAFEAKINRDTWADAEAGKRDLRPHNRAGVERVLRWAHGSIEAILDGGEPTPADTGPPSTGRGELAPSDEERLAKAYEDIEGLDVSEATKDRMRASIVRSYKRHAAARSAAARSADQTFEDTDEAVRKPA